MMENIKNNSKKNLQDLYRSIVRGLHTVLLYLH